MIDDHVDDESAAEAARQLIDDCEQKMLVKGVDLETVDQFAHAHRVQAQIEAKMGTERRAAEQQRAYGEARDRHEVREMLWGDFQEAQRYLRRSKMSAESKSRAIHGFGIEQLFSYSPMRNAWMAVSPGLVLA